MPAIRTLDLVKVFSASFTKMQPVGRVSRPMTTSVMPREYKNFSKHLHAKKTKNASGCETKPELPCSPSCSKTFRQPETDKINSDNAVCISNEVMPALYKNAQESTMPKNAVPGFCNRALFFGK